MSVISVRVFVYPSYTTITGWGVYLWFGFLGFQVECRGLRLEALS